MKDTFDKLFALGLGVAAVSKEQIEKLVNELVEKGNVTKNESSEIIDDLIRKGKETQEKWESVVNERVDEALHKMNIVTRKEFDELAKRMTVLEEQLKQQQSESEASAEPEKVQEDEQ